MEPHLLIRLFAGDVNIEINEWNEATENKMNLSKLGFLERFMTLDHKIANFSYLGPVL
jgi:hypothetical protein